MRRVLIAVLPALFLTACGEPEAPSGGDKAAGAPLPSGGWAVDYGASRLGFAATQTGKTFEGEFKKYDAEIVFDPDDLSTASIKVAVDMSSAKTGDLQRDLALPEADWFDVKAYPSARYVSTDIEKTGEGSYVAHGALSIRDATKPLDLPFTLEITGDKAHAVGEASLVRTDYGVGQGDFQKGEWVGLDVKVTVDVTASR